MANDTPRLQTITADRQNPAWKLDHAPVGEAPSLGELHDQLATRQTCRSLRRKRVVGAVAGCLLGLIVMMFCPSITFDAVPGTPTADLPNSPPSHHAHVIDQPELNQPELNAEPTRAGGGTLSQPTAPSSQPSIRLFANVQASAPVFVSDQQTGALFPVGWVRSSSHVPVDLNAFSREQMETLHSVLNDKPQNVSL